MSQISLQSDVGRPNEVTKHQVFHEPGGDMTVQASTRTSRQKWNHYRNVLAFWILGLCNNFPYVVMLSAANDIIKTLEGGPTHNASNATSSCELLYNATTNSSGYIGREKCTGQGTYVILLADIIPTFLIKLMAPYFMNFLPYWFRVCVVVVSSALSFVLVALSVNEPLVIFGVALASIGSGFGEITYLSLTSRYDKSTVSGWSSGTGAAGVGASLVYAGLRSFLNADVTLYIQLVVPAIMLVTYLLLLGTPESIIPGESDNETTGGAQEIEDEDGNDKHDEQVTLLSDPPPPPPSSRRRCPGLNKAEVKYWWDHVKYIPHLWKYMLPLFVVYAAEYMINQGFFELLYNQNTYIGALCLDQATQYRWLQVMYQVGVLISRSSVSIYHFKHFWILALLQLLNFVFFYVATWYLFIPYFWITMIVVLYEGLLGGGVYVNAFYSISIDVPKIHREFSMGVASVADSTGITVAGVAAVFIHSSLCARIGYQD